MARQATRARQGCKASGPARDSVGLCGRPFDLELSDPVARNRRNVALSLPADTEMCRSLLTALLRRACPADATASADARIAEFGPLPAALAPRTSDRARSIGAEPARYLADIQ